MPDQAFHNEHAIGLVAIGASADGVVAPGLDS